MLSQMSARIWAAFWVKGKLKGYVVKCGCHGREFDVRTGLGLGSEHYKLKVYKCKVLKGEIAVNFKEALS